ncbi:TonB-dependent receptor [Persephonella atlantica]|uniref:TonB-dependent receptor n=1 Tax=Persephonella atlantica TaxID=2699429 RepID=A0ABS1GH95_9AQUI|nr:TonB-dependent receptor [Persephonella atlantica]MBK3332289.1 TonB-dependent receptor [Persephonella atlantica]
MKKLLAAGLLVPAIFSFSSAQEVIKVKKITVAEEVTEEETKGETREATEEEIKITRQIDIGEILSNLFPEINHIRKGGTANDITVRGFGRDNINVLLDGMRIYGACPNRMDPAVFHMSTRQVKEVQILEGPFDVENQGSLAAAVNLISKDPEKGIGGSVYFTGGYFDYMHGGFEAYGGNDKVKVLVGYSKQFSHPYKSGEGKRITEYANYKPSELDHTSFNIDNVWVKTVINPNDENTIKINYGFDEAKDVLYPYLMMDAVYDRTHRINGEYEIKPLGIKISAYWNFVKHDMQDRWRVSSSGWSRGYMMRTLAKTKTYGAKVVKSWKIGGVNLKTGIDAYLRNWKADNVVMNLDNRGMIPDVDIKNVGAFIKGSKKVNNFIISAGFRIDRTKSEADPNALGTANSTLYSDYYGTNYSLSKTDTYPSGNVVVRYKLDKRSSVYVGFGHTVRVPDPEERYIALAKPMTKPNWVGNPNLKRTKNNEIDAGFEYYAGLFGIKGNIFYSDLTDYVYLYKLTTGPKPAQSYQNIDAHIYGGDITVIGMLTDTVSVEAGAAYQRGKKDSGNYTDSDLAEIPPLKTRLAVKYDNGTVFGQIEGIYAARQGNVDSDLQEQPTKSYYVVNIKSGINAGNRAFIGIGIDNLFDKNYYTHLSYLRNPFSTGTKVPEPGRFVYMNVNYRF